MAEVLGASSRDPHDVPVENEQVAARSGSLVRLGLGTARVVSESSRFALVQEVALKVATDLVFMADPVVLQRDDPAERVACGIRLVARLALHHPAAAGFLAQLGWPDTDGRNVLLDFVRRDLQEGMRRGRFREMPMSLALNMVTGGVIGAIHCMLKPSCEPDFAEMSAAAVLRALGVPAQTSAAIAYKPLRPITAFPEGLLAETAPPAEEAVAEAHEPMLQRRRGPRKPTAR